MGFDQYFSDDIAFDRLLPAPLQRISRNQWTPLEVARQAASYLSEKPGAKILDMGSGAGKFCLAAAHFFPRSEFYGIESRKDYFNAAQNAKALSGITNAHFMLGDILNADLSSFSGLYFFNSFEENLSYGASNLPGDESILEIDDDAPDESPFMAADRYLEYSAFLSKKLAACSAGTRLVTYFGQGTEIPAGFRMQKDMMNSNLRFWLKIR